MTKKSVEQMAGECVMLHEFPISDTEGAIEVYKDAFKAGCQSRDAEFAELNKIIRDNESKILCHITIGELLEDEVKSRTAQLEIVKEQLKTAEFALDGVLSSNFMGLCLSDQQKMHAYKCYVSDALSIIEKLRKK